MSAFGFKPQIWGRGGSPPAFIGKLAVILALIALGLPQPSPAKKLYRYQDAQGIWHFTDQPPPEGQSAQVEQLQVHALPRQVFVTRTGPGERPVFWVRNGYAGPIEVEFTLTEAENMLSDRPLPLRMVIPAYGEARGLVLQPRRADQAWSYRYRWRYTPGDPGARHEPTALYRPPFTPGARFQLGQSFGGRFSHQEPGSYYAVDIPMPEGTPVHAARDGVVMETATDFFEGGENRQRYGRRANFVRILHDDGTLAVYGHLQLESVQVRPGQRVKTGQWIARSGNTGFSRGPHLHFVIQRNEDMALVSVPFRFQDAIQGPVSPQPGLTLTAPGTRSAAPALPPDLIEADAD